MSLTRIEYPGIKNCPFCGCTASLYKNSDMNGVDYFCKCDDPLNYTDLSMNCGATVNGACHLDGDKAPGLAVEWWNRRSK
jgi:hypothetical protein